MHRRLAWCGERARSRLIPSGASIDLDRAVLDVIVLVKLVEIAASHRTVSRLTRVDCAASGILRSEVIDPKILLLPAGRES